MWVSIAAAFFASHFEPCFASGKARHLGYWMKKRTTGDPRVRLAPRIVYQMFGHIPANTKIGAVSRFNLVKHCRGQAPRFKNYIFAGSRYNGEASITRSGAGMCLAFKYLSDASREA